MKRLLNLVNEEGKNQYFLVAPKYLIEGIVGICFLVGLLVFMHLNVAGTSYVARSSCFYFIIEVDANFTNAIHFLTNIHFLHAPVRRLETILTYNVDRTFQPVEAPGNHMEIRNLVAKLDSEKTLTFPNISISKGSKTAVVGPSGSGKSTLLLLLLGLKNSLSDNTLIDGLEKKLKDVNIVENCVFIPQAPLIFNGTLLENILMGREGISLDMVEKLIRSVRLEDRFPGDITAYEISADGNMLSGGENKG